MRGARRAFASRANGRRSKGPTSAAGRQRHGAAVRHHGLSLPVLRDDVLASDVDRLAQEIIASAADGAVDDAHRDRAARIAEAMIDLRRVRLAKRPLAIALDADPGDLATLKRLARLDRYEARARARRKFAIREFAAAAASSHRSHFGRMT